MSKQEKNSSLNTYYKKAEAIAEGLILLFYGGWNVSNNVRWWTAFSLVSLSGVNTITALQTAVSERVGFVEGALQITDSALEVISAFLLFHEEWKLSQNGEYEDIQRALFSFSLTLTSRGLINLRKGDASRLLTGVTAVTAAGNLISSGTQSLKDVSLFAASGVFSIIRGLTTGPGEDLRLETKHTR
jgi:hypothetical protein